MELLEESFVPREECTQKEGDHSKNEKKKDEPFTVIDIRIDQKEAYRIYDRFDEDEIEVLPDGNFMVHMHAVVDDWVYGVILGFGSSAEVLAPEAVRHEVIQRIREMAERYEIRESKRER